MAELPKDIRKPGGALVSARGPFTRRVLLPTEADLCNALGLTEEEYFQFLEGVAAKVKERPEAYDLVPNLVNGPLVVAAGLPGAGTLTAFGQIVVGIALSVVSYLLTPKPPSMKQGTNERTADIAGLKRFAPQFSFNSIQDLANLGDLIPLVFANRDQNPNGGIRVNSQLIWSQMVSLGSYQQLKILALFSLGEIARKPEVKGYAIGDLLIDNYHADKIYKDTNDDIPFQLNAIPNVDEDNIPFSADSELGHIFRVDDKRYFSGTRNPTTQATFGLSNPMPNATVYKLPYELVGSPSNPNNPDYRPAGRIVYKKRRKLLGSWPMCAGFVNSGTADQQAGRADATVGDYLTYQIVGSGTFGLYEGIAYQQNTDNLDLTMDPHGVEDVNSAIKTVREATDSYLVIGEQYMAGSTLLTCEEILEDNLPVNGRPWDGTKVRSASFKVIETGRYESLDNSIDGLGYHCQNPYWLDGNTENPGRKKGITFTRRKGKFFTVKPPSGDDHFFYEQEYDDSPDAADLYNPNSRYALQKVNLGTISNNRRCNITEIGIKSKVFKEMQFANVNSKPTEAKINEIYDYRSSLTLGNVQKFITRYSFFKLQVRKVGQDTWNWLKPEVNTNAHTGLFCVRGNTPEFQYNYIRIDQPTFDQYEYRFFPWPGAAVVKEVKTDSARSRYNPINAILLNSNTARTAGSTDKFTCSVNGEDFAVQFAGNKNHVLTEQNLSNSEWNLGTPDALKVGDATYQVLEFNGNNHDGSRKDYSISNLPILRPSEPVFTNKLFYPPNYGGYINGSGAHGTIIVGWQNHPSNGYTQYSLYINKADVTENIQGLDGPAWANHQVKAPGDFSDVEFHYTTLDGRGGKFILGTHQLNTSQGHPIYGVTKIEQTPLTATPSFSGEVDVKKQYSHEDGSGLKANVVVYSLGSEWYAEWELSDVGDEYLNNQEVYLDKNDIFTSDIINAGYDDITFTLNVGLSNTDVYSDEIGPSKLNLYDAAADFWQYEGDRSSHLEGPEHQITYCNEIVETEGSERATYENLAYAGLSIKSSKEWTNFSQFSAYFKQGIKVEKLVFDGMGPHPLKDATSLFPEIAYALLTDEKIGAGAVINADSVNKTNMTIAAKFCKANKFFWDGVISNKVNLREFIFEQGTHCLLDFTIIGGQFSLYPSVPFDNNSYEIKNDKDVVIKAMFTDGNIKDLQVAFLSPEDRQAFKANVIYRNEKENGFPENKSIVIRLADEEDANGKVLVSHVNDPLETFDLSGFCTSRKHALDFGRYILANRKFVDHTMTFKTAPHFVNGVQPGDYIRVFSTTQHVQRFNNGAILDNGTVVCKDISELASGTQPKNFYWWNTKESVVQEDSYNFSNWTSDSKLPATYRNSLFTIKELESSDQCYKVESMTFGEDGLIELSGSYAKLDGNKLAMLQKWDDTDIDNPLFDYDLE